MSFRDFFPVVRSLLASLSIGLQSGVAHDLSCRAEIYLGLFVLTRSVSGARLHRSFDWRF